MTDQEQIKQLVDRYIQAIHTQDKDEFLSLWTGSDADTMISITRVFSGDQAIYQEFLIDLIQQRYSNIDLYSDSQYVINGLEKGWAKGWRARGWKKADKSPALNPDLWAPLLAETEKHVIHYHWLKGHAGHPENERCDRLAVEQSKQYGGRQA